MSFLQLCSVFVHHKYPNAYIVSWKVKSPFYYQTFIHIMQTYRLHRCRGLRPPHHKCLGYGIKSSDDQSPVPELWGMWSTPSLALNQSSLWPRMVAPDRVSFMGQIELTFKLCANKWLMLFRIIRNKTVWLFYWV